MPADLPAHPPPLRLLERPSRARLPLRQSPKQPRPAWWARWLAWPASPQR